MDENQPNKEEEVLDPEYEKIKKLTPGLEEEPKKEAPKKEEEPKKEEPKEEPKKEEEPEKEKEDLSDDEDEEEDPKDKKTRPEKYIPVKQYTEEKRKHKETLEEKDRRIAELEKIADTTKPDSKLSDDKIAKYAEKHGIDVDDARAELERIRDAQEFFAPEKKSERIELSEEQKDALKEAELIKAKQVFADEYENVATPEILSIYKDATPEQIRKAKAEVEKIACTKAFLDKPLDYVIYKSKAELEKFFKKEVAGPEGSRPSTKEVGELKVADFATGKASFDKLDEMSETERNKMVEAFDLKTYEAFSKYNDRNANINLNRGGKKVGI